MKANKIALGVLGGIATGAILGILFAPAKGADTRKKILKKGGNYADEFKDKLDNLTGTIKNNYEKMFQNGKELVLDGKSKYEDAKNEIKNGSI
jgi:gas vesicle protein